MSALRLNFRAVQQHVGTHVTVCAVVKADAYGHGALQCSKALEQEGAQWLGVTSLDEAIPLREAGVKARILLMTGFWRGEEAEIIRLGLTPTIWEPGQIEALEAEAVRLGVDRFAIHLKIDSGMGRLGVATSELPGIYSALRSSTHLTLEGVSTHFAASEIVGGPSIERQSSVFDDALKNLRSEGLRPPLIHTANTAAMISRPASWNTMVRPGLALYGYHLPLEHARMTEENSELKFEPVLTWKTRILSIRNVAANQALGYGGTYVTQVPSSIAVLPVGYADGLNRKVSPSGRVIIAGTYFSIVGRISMDLTLIDVTGISGIGVGDEAVLLGSAGGLSVSANEHAELAETIPYEILCNISKRVPRKYVP
jgi:alanine racemase